MINLKFEQNLNRKIIYAIGKDRVRVVKCSVNMYDESGTVLIEEGIAIIDGNINTIQLIKNKHLKIPTGSKYMCKLFNFDKTTVDDRFVDSGLEIDLLECRLLSNYNYVFPNESGRIQCEMYINSSAKDGNMIFRITK